MWFFFRFITWEQRKLGEVTKINMGQSPAGVNYTANPNDAILVQGNADMVDGWVCPRVYTRQITKKAHVGDLIFSVRAPVGEVGKTQYDVVIGRGVAAISGNEYIFQTLKQMNAFGYWTKLSAGSTFESINSDTLKSAKLFVPKENEQRKIGEILLKIDNLITLHQRKQNDKFSLFKPKNYANFLANSWEQRKLGDIGSVAMNRRIFKEQTTPTGEVPFYKIGTFGGVADAFITEQLFEEFKTKYPYPKIGDILVSASGSIGRFVEYRGEKAYFQDSNIIWLEHDDSIDKTFLKAFYAVVKWSGLEGSTIKRLYNKNVLETEIKLPSLKEQRQVGQFFEQLDNLITLHQRKDFSMRCGYDLFLKMVNTQKMANAWEQRKLGEVGKAQSGVGFPDREQGGKTGVPFYKVSDMNNAGNEHEMCTANNYVSEAQCKKNGWTPITEISVVFAKVGAAIMLNRKRLVRISFLLDNNTMAYKFGTEWDIDFGKTLFERIDLTDLVQIGALPSYNATDVECVEISMPDKPEQHRIGVFFKQLDNLITLHQREHRQKKNPFLNENRTPFREVIANAWEQRKLGEVANIQKGQQLGKAEMSNNGAFYVLNGGMEPSGYTNQYNTFANTISISEGGNSCGYVSLNLEQFWSGGHNYTLQNPRIDTFFLYQWLKRHEKGIMALRVGSGLPNIQKSALQDVIVAYPKKSEQRAIAEILNKIDNLITLHQRGLIKIQGDKNGKKRSIRRIVQRLFRTLDKSLQRRRN